MRYYIAKFFHFMDAWKRARDYERKFNQMVDELIAYEKCSPHYHGRIIGHMLSVW